LPSRREAIARTTDARPIAFIAGNARRDPGSGECVPVNRLGGFGRDVRQIREQADARVGE
jgi:hypothetical protein